MPTLKRPLLRWHGGKWKLASWIIKHLPDHRIYVEPYGGAGSVLLRKPRAYAEIYNDLDDEVVNLFRVLQDRTLSAELDRLLRLTPFARSEFELAYAPSDHPVERARRLLIRSFMGFGSDGHNRAVTTGFRATSNRSGTTPAHDWMNYPDALVAIVDRLSGIVIENADACAVMKRHDRRTTLHYVDPPYLPETRSAKSRKGGGKYHAYRHEMSEEDHDAMLATLSRLRGMVVISGYPSDLYEDRLKRWGRVECAARADGARARTEVLWLNPAAQDALAKKQGDHHG
jgi:DNA adenine methylase